MELYHSDKYLGADFSDGIKHWKYVKREKLSNGKYRYYYTDKNNIMYTTDSKKDDKYHGGANRYSKYTNMDRYGNTNTIQTKKGKGLIFGTSEKHVEDLGDTQHTTTTYYDTKLERSLIRGKKKLKKLFKKIKNIKFKDIISNDTTSKTTVLTSKTKNVNVKVR